MREVKWVVAMDGNNHVVVGWQHQIFQLVNASPVSRLNENRPVGIAPANRRNGAGINRIHQAGCGIFMRFIIEFKRKPVGEVLVMRRDLTPQREKFFRLPRRVPVQFVEVMDVDHHSEVRRQCIGDHEINA